MIGVLLAFSSLAGAFEIVIPAAQIEEGKGSISVYYTQSRKDLRLTINSKDQITVGGNSYYSQVSNDLETKSENSAVTAQFISNPWSGFYYWARIGIGNYSIEIPSVTVTNRLTGSSNGWRAGIGMRKLLFPDTIVSPAFSLEAGLVYSRYPLQSMQSGTGVAIPVSNSVELTEVQAALLMSKKFSGIEPYGGLKVFKDYLMLQDETSTGCVSGTKDNVGVFGGAKIYVYPHEALIVEGSMLGESSITVAWNVAF
jgi:hypothetical protein